MASFAFPFSGGSVTATFSAPACSPTIRAERARVCTRTGNTIPSGCESIWITCCPRCLGTGPIRFARLLLPLRSLLQNHWTFPLRVLSVDIVLGHRLRADHAFYARQRKTGVHSQGPRPLAPLSSGHGRLPVES